MKITIYPHNNLPIPGSVEEFARSRIERLTHYLPRIREVRLELAYQNNKRGEDNSIAQLTLYHERGAILRTEEKVGGFSPSALEAAISAALDKMYRRIDRFKGKRQDQRRKRARFAPSLEELELAEETPEEEFEEYADIPAPQPDGEFEPIVARRKYIDLAPMSEIDAIEQMELLGHTFFLYYDQTLNKKVVLYKRSEGDYGLLIPEEAKQA